MRAMLVAALLCAAAPQERPAGISFRTEVPAHAVDAILTRPTDRSVTLSLVAYQALTAYVACGPVGGALMPVGPPQAFRPGEHVPVEVVIGNLTPHTAYAWELRAVRDGGGETVAARGTFHTQRPPGAPFTFTITADSHLDEQTDPALYTRTLANAAADHPDFHVDLGDTFMTEKYPGDFHTALPQYLAQRHYFGLLCGSAPLFLTLGNHDGELGWLLGDDADNIVRWSCRMRKAYFPMPEPSAFYSGNAVPEGASGLPQNYYAWQWGDALCIVLDPFWPTRTKPSRGDGEWARTLGEPQYRWLQRTLASSRAAYKFVFIHHLVGGADQNSRGGSEAAGNFEWGGRNADGTPGFAQHRPGWELPIHDLLRQHHVTAVFHGHDHFFARQERDGIVYQLVPQPGHPGRRTDRPAAEYGYNSGTILGGSGHLRVSVTPRAATMEFVRAVLPADERGAERNAAVADGCALRPPP